MARASAGRATAAVHARSQKTDDAGTGATPAVTSYVGVVTRALAFALDAAVINIAAVLVGAVVTLVFSVVPASQAVHTLVVAAGGVAFALWATAYFLVFWTTTGQTPGNRAMQISVVRSDGTRVRPRDALVRLVGIVLSMPLFLGFLPILVTERRRGLHDWLAGTVVVEAGRQAGATAVDLDPRHMA